MIQILPRTRGASSSVRVDTRIVRRAGSRILALAVAASPLTAQESVVVGPCSPENPGVEIRGVVADLLARLPLGGAVVILQKPAAFVPQVIGRSQADGDGSFTFCTGAIGEGWEVEAQMDTVVSRTLPVPSHGLVDTLYIPWSEPVTLSGVVRSGATGEGLEGASVSVQDRFVRAIADGSGRFRLRGLGGGPVILTTTHIGYAPRVDTLLAESGAYLSLEIRLGMEAVELKPIVVTVTGSPSLRMRGTRELGMTREEVNEALPRSIDFIQLLRQANIPGLLVSPARNSVGFCIEFLRSSGGCAMLQVFVNGIRISDPAEFVANLDPSSVAEFIVLRPAFAQFQYMGPLTHNGVLDITLR